MPPGGPRPVGARRRTSTSAQCANKTYHCWCWPFPHGCAAAGGRRGRRRVQAYGPHAREGVSGSRERGAGRRRARVARRLCVPPQRRPRVQGGRQGVPLGQWCPLRHGHQCCFLSWPGALKKACCWGYAKQESEWRSLVLQAGEDAERDGDGGACGREDSSER